MELTHYIEQLLQQHDCVIVPKFGGFIANYQGAHIDWSSKKLIPPAKSVLFNSHLIQNDGLLGNTVATNQTIPYADALSFIDTQVKQWQVELAKGKRIEIGELGFLFKSNNQLVFEQSRDVNILLSAYGLSEISFVNFAETKPVEKIKESVVNPVQDIAVVQPKKTEAVVIALQPNQSVESIAEEVQVEDEKVIPIQRNRNSRILRYAGIAAALPLLFYSYWIPMETDFIDTGKIQFADFNPIRKAPERQYQMRIETFDLPAIENVKSWDELTENLSDNVTVYNYQFDDQLYIPIRLDKTATSTIEEIENKNSVVEAATPVSSELKYHVIGGCFSSKENAENLVADLKKQGYQASIFDLKGGLYRVSAGDYANSAQADSKLGEFKSNGFSGWILKK